MPVSLDGQLVVAISSRALFDFEEENKVFEQSDDRAYMKLQLERLEAPAKPGVAFSLVKKLLAFNDANTQRVEVVILSRNDPVSGMRVFRSAQHYGLPIQRGSFTRGQSPWRYLKPLNANLFLSTHLSDVRAALDAGVPAAQVYPNSAHASEAHPHEVRIAFDGDAVLFSDEAERVFQAEGLSAFQAHEHAKGLTSFVGGAFQAIANSIAPLATRRHAGHSHSNGTGHCAQRARTRTRHPDPHAMEH
jgi:5'-nucleotidase